MWWPTWGTTTSRALASSPVLCQVSTTSPTTSWWEVVTGRACGRTWRRTDRWVWVEVGAIVWLKCPLNFWSQSATINPQNCYLVKLFCTVCVREFDPVSVCGHSYSSNSIIWSCTTSSVQDNKKSPGLNDKIKSLDGILLTIYSANSNTYHADQNFKLQV